MTIKRVAVIGAGASGLAALRFLAEKPHLYSPVAYELSANIGGTWVYTDATGYDSTGRRVHSSMYKNLVVNIPKEMMAFEGFPFPEKLPSFFSHEHVLRYLEDFTDHFELRKYITFNSEVTSVRPHTGYSGLQWALDVGNSKIPGKEIKTELFDAVLVCVGHYSEPYMPDIPGLLTFKGRILHSHDYRVPEDFEDMRVAILGARFSGQDIAIEVAQFAREVILSHNKERVKYKLPSNVKEVYGIANVDGNSITMKNGDVYDADSIIFCTGYVHRYPFLSPECHVTVTDKLVTPLYKHVIHTEYSSLVFIGITARVIPFPHAEFQIKFALSAWEGLCQLPSKEEMDEDVALDLQKRLSVGIAPSHIMGTTFLQEYEDDLALTGKFKPRKKNFYEAVATFYNFIFMGFMKYKTLDVPVTKDGLIDVDAWRLYPIVHK